MKAQDIMTRNPSSVTPDAPVREAAQLMRTEDVGIIPVVESADRSTLLGVITDRDIAIRCVAEGKDGTCSVREVMSSGDLTTCRADDEVDEVMNAMSREKVRRIPIVDERGGLVGIVAQADIVLKARNDSKAERTVEQISEPGR
jgi:CBS domain-containing protein